MEKSDRVPLKKVCSLAGVEPRIARRLLRDGKKKRTGRWSWTPVEAEKIVTFLKEKSS